RKENAFYLARDRMGEKPLYYGFNNKNFLFGSELKAISAFPDFKKDINKQALALYLQYNYIPTPYSIFQGIKKLKPGAILRISIDDIRKKYLPSPKTYWSVRDAVINGKANQFEGTEDDASIKFDKLLRQSISGQMLADVPLGAFLSGGIDSTMVTAIMQSESMVPVKTFTIGFQESEYNEANYANAIASFLKTNHTELYVTPNEVMDVIPALPKIYDEPFSDPSQIPTYLLSKLTREQVTVSLSGDGGDELFGGYNRYISAPLIWRRFQWMPRNIRLVIAGIMTYFPPALWD
ncbi:MAG: asparagine synthetase B, partial [Candidatus Dadabacteria bacterium]|nr:asparagine synthetase B [Candidatus Dadabacteria bacterium]